MICTLTARRLKPGAYDQFRSAWDVGGVPMGWKHIYHCRDLEDTGVVISFGLFDGTPNELRDAQARLGRRAQVERIGSHVEEVLLDGSYEVVEHLTT
ncbi:MAG: hypothetical protein JO168_03145 [Solirubrobacterales bacterium]|nr:hypothetical protein [Solirubrobacterales bacterium]